jgi:hypothetical protein
LTVVVVVAAAAVAAGWTSSPFRLQIASWMVLDVVAADRVVVEAVQTTRRLHPGLVVREEARNAAAAADSDSEESQT